MADHSARSSPSNCPDSSSTAKPKAIAAHGDAETAALDSKLLVVPSAEPTANQSSSLWSAVAHNLQNFGNALGSRVTQVGKAARHTATGVGDAIAHTTLQAGKAAAGLSEATAKQTQQLFTQATQGAGEATALVSSHPMLRKVGNRLNWNWWVNATNQVDLAKAEVTVRALQQQYPHHRPSQLAHLLVLQKAMNAGIVGWATNLIPGVATAFLTVDLAANLALQAEMVYQIAATYGSDLQDPARKGEVLAIFGVALGGSRAIKLGLGLLRNPPIAGALVGVSANAAMLYLLSDVACCFYEAKLNESVSAAQLSRLKRASRDYLTVAIAQQAIMDQILVHMILAGTDKRSWDEILPTLKTLNLHPSSLKTIAENLKTPKPLYLLLNQLNSDFAAPLLPQARKIARRNQSITPQEAKILETIAEKFELHSPTTETSLTG
ncbi:MAG TPA: hypothetical protein V6C63_05030 [Allocoleopsis sp.]